MCDKKRRIRAEKTLKKIRICDTIYSGGKAYEKKNV